MAIQVQRGFGGREDLMRKQGVQQSAESARSALQSQAQMAARKMELRDAYMREDLKSLYGYDIGVAGGGELASGLNMLSQDAAERLKNAKNPIEAQEILAGFKQQYNAFSQRSTLAEDARTQYDSAFTDGDLPIVNGQRAVRPEASQAQSARNSWDNPFGGANMEVIDGVLMVENEEGKMVPMTSDPRFGDTSAWNLDMEKVDSGTLDDWALSGEVLSNMALTVGSDYGGNEQAMQDRASVIYQENLELNNDAGYKHRDQVLQVLEVDQNLTISPEDRELWLSGKIRNPDGSFVNSTIESMYNAGQQSFQQRARWVGSYNGGAGSSGRSGGGRTGSTGYTGVETTRTVPVTRNDPQGRVPAEGGQPGQTEDVSVIRTDESLQFHGIEAIDLGNALDGNEDVNLTSWAVDDQGNLNVIIVEEVPQVELQTLGPDGEKQYRDARPGEVSDQTVRRERVISGSGRNEDLSERDRKILETAELTLEGPYGEDMRREVATLRTNRESQEAEALRQRQQQARVEREAQRQSAEPETQPEPTQEEPASPADPEPAEEPAATPQPAAPADPAEPEVEEIPPGPEESAQPQTDVDRAAVRNEGVARIVANFPHGGSRRKKRQWFRDNLSNVSDEDFEALVEEGLPRPPRGKFRKKYDEAVARMDAESAPPAPAPEPEPEPEQEEQRAPRFRDRSRQVGREERRLEREEEREFDRERRRISDAASRQEEGELGQTATEQVVDTFPAGASERKKRQWFRDNTEQLNDVEFLELFDEIPEPTSGPARERLDRINREMDEVRERARQAADPASAPAEPAPAPPAAPAVPAEEEVMGPQMPSEFEPAPSGRTVEEVAEENDVPVETAATNAQTAAEVVPELAPENSTPEEEAVITEAVENAPVPVTAEEVANMTTMEFATAMLGLDETDDKEKVQEILDQWNSDATGNNVETSSGAWCAAWVAHVLKSTGHEDTLEALETALSQMDKDSVVAKELRKKGRTLEEARDQGENTLIRALNFSELGTEVSGSSEGNVGEAQPGDVVIIRSRGNNFHVGFYAGTDEEGRLLLLGGNQHDGSRNRRGEKSTGRVTVNSYDMDRVLTVRRPFQGAPTEEERNAASVAALGASGDEGATR